MPKREALPDDLKELCRLCREGKLFEVKEWIANGRRFAPPPGNYQTTPFLVALATGFHSLVEVFLQAGIDQKQKDRALEKATAERKLALVELLCAYGADPRAIDSGTVVYSGDPGIIRWFVAHGMNLESGNPIAWAFRYGRRGLLGVYMSIRDTVPGVRMQAAIALRYYAGKGNLKWVSLLLWAGADPRLPVQDLDRVQDPEFFWSALEEAILFGHCEIVKKIGLDPEKDNISELLKTGTISCHPQIIKMMLEVSGERLGLETLNHALGNTIKRLSSYLDSVDRNESVLECVEILAQRGARWRPADRQEMTWLRMALAKTPIHEAVRCLKRLIESKAIEQPVFAELMKTPKMTELLSVWSPHIIMVRQYAGIERDRKKLPAARHRSSGISANSA